MFHFWVGQLVVGQGGVSWSWYFDELVNFRPKAGIFWRFCVLFKICVVIFNIKIWFLFTYLTNTRSAPWSTSLLLLTNSLGQRLDHFPNPLDQLTWSTPWSLHNPLDQLTWQRFDQPPTTIALAHWPIHFWDPWTNYMISTWPSIPWPTHLLPLDQFLTSPWPTVLDRYTSETSVRPSPLNVLVSALANFPWPSPRQTQ